MELSRNWKAFRLGDLLDYEQPTKYIVENDLYNDDYEIPVLTAGKSFILGYTNETNNQYANLPAIIFDDFTTESKFVDFKFKVKSSAMKILTTDDSKANLRFLFYLLSTLKIDSSQHKRYWISKFAELTVKVPPLNTQKRIAEILDKADALRKKGQQLLKYYDDLAQSLFIDMFGDPVRNEKGWPIKTIEQIVKRQKHSIKRGPFGGALKKEIFVESGYLVYEQYHALNNDFKFGRYFITQEKYKELIAFDVKPGDIIISCSGVYLGKLAIVPKTAKPGIINQALLKLTIDNDIYSSELFVKIFTHKSFKDKYLESDRGAAIPNFPPMTTFKQFRFISPPIELQKQFVLQMHNIDLQIEKLKFEMQETENLFHALLQQAFNGGSN